MPAGLPKKDKGGMATIRRMEDVAPEEERRRLLSSMGLTEEMLGGYASTALTSAGFPSDENAVSNAVTRATAGHMFTVVGNSLDVLVIEVMRTKVNSLFEKLLPAKKSTSKKK